MKWLAGLASLLSQPSVEGVAGPVVYLDAILRPLYRISSNHAGLAVPGEHLACLPRAISVQSSWHDLMLVVPPISHIRQRADGSTTPWRARYGEVLAVKFGGRFSAWAL